MTDDSHRIIDTAKAVRNSKSKFIRSLPGFLVNIIRKFIREDEINLVIYHNREKSGVPFINDVLKEWNVIVDTTGEENIPPAGRFIFVANHPVGAMDALALFSMIYKHFPDVVSPSNEILNQISNLKPVLIGINVFGKNSRETIEKLNKAFESDSQIIFFPSGEVSRRKKGIISDMVWQKTFITKAVEYKRDIIPVHISGRNSGLFYFIANLRKLLGIKMYIETLLLPREMIRQRNSSISLTVGKVIPCQTFNNKTLTHNEWAQEVRSMIYSLPAKL
jgi:1-acyl-sn-glycerol-3-phosphate acyltransferase